MPITTPIVSFIEELMIKYHLEDNFIEGDPLLKEKLSETENISDRAVLKLIFGEKIKEQLKTGKSLEEFLPSMKIKRIIEGLLEKKYSSKDLPELIKTALNISDSEIKEISDAISSNVEILKLIAQPLSETDTEENINESTEEEKKVINKKSIANILLK
ncbi:MAG: hypothetical protein WAW15_00925 [Minisyncoccales bacterium]